MFSKIFLSVLLLTCIYTYMLKSIQNNDDINLQKLPDNFNFELDGIQKIKPNLEKPIPLINVLKPVLKRLFGPLFLEVLEKWDVELYDMLDFLNDDIMKKVKEVKKPNDMKRIFSLPKLKPLFKDMTQTD